MVTLTYIITAEACDLNLPSCLIRMSVSRNYIILAPCYNEALGISGFLTELEAKLTSADACFSVVIIDDGSNDNTLEILNNYCFSNDKFTLRVARLKFNMGHQEAIRQGLIFVKELNVKVDGIVVMDSDGEDDPKAIHELIQHQESDIVFAGRGKRRESRAFRIGYALYKLLFRFITGQTISFGNFSLISPAVLNSIAGQRFVHYAGFLSKQRFRKTIILCDRQKRINGDSKMNFRSLVFHGLYSLVEYAEELLFSLIKLFIVILILLAFLAGFVLYSKFISHQAIYGWTSTMMTYLLISVLVITSTIILGLLLISVRKAINQSNGQYYKVR